MLPPAAVQADSGDVLRQIALSGGGLAVLPRWLVAADLERGALVEVLEDVQFTSSPIRALWLGRRQPRPAVRAFIDWLVDAHAAPARQG